ncbi:MAG: transglutaminase [Hyphomonas sp.]|nr:transglutaminase [Hyphomonas sp.]|tara:strand:+ start:1664 stop:2458 length:795 start_codon:yes stop_codon:yes gene_type:complete
MRVSIKASLEYSFPEPADVLLALEAARAPDQRVIADALTVTPPCDLSVADGPDDKGVRQWMQARGDVMITYEALVDVTRGPVELAGLSVPSHHELPSDVTSYLFPSRYCESDRMMTFVQRTFSGLQGGDQVLAMADWIYEHFDYVPGASDGETTAADSFMMRQGVCRDYAHVLISFARSAGIPARMVSAYAPGIKPPDFHAVVEVWLNDAWRLIDPTKLADERNLVRIAAGRDATDISFMTIFGVAELKRQSVDAVTVEDSVVS